MFAKTAPASGSLSCCSLFKRANTELKGRKKTQISLLHAVAIQPAASVCGHTACCNSVCGRTAC